MIRPAVREIPTPVGPARAHLLEQPPAQRRGLLVLGHGAGGGITAPDLVAVAGAATATGWSVALVEQPYRVAGRRAPAPAAQLDLAWIAVLAALRRRRGALTVVVGGRSSGSRVACRTAAATGASGVVALAFPLHPPGRPGVSRAEELGLPDVPVLVVQGESDPFGGPADLPPGPTVVAVRADHSLKGAAARAAADAVAGWLAQLVA